MRCIFLWALLFATINTQAQQFNQNDIAKKLADIMNENYVYPDEGLAMFNLIHKNIAKGIYSGLESKNELANTLQEDLRSIINDRHIRVMFNEDRAQAMRNRDPNGGRPPSENKGFEKVEVLEGNIGYLDLRGFADARSAEHVAIPAMEKLIETDAIIFDLRKNGGGSPSMIRLISSYLFGKEPVHLNTFYWRPANNYTETWTDPSLASRTKPDIPIYVLTSNYTFSAAEEFTYNLKNLERATIIGETTGGGAHPGGPRIIEGGFIVNVPQGRAINPITKTNWEGVGIEPHIETSADAALDKALELARKALNEN